MRGKRKVHLNLYAIKCKQISIAVKQLKCIERVREVSSIKKQLPVGPNAGMQVIVFFETKCIKKIKHFFPCKREKTRAGMRKDRRRLDRQPMLKTIHQ